MPTALPTWLQVNPSDFLAAAQAGAGVGLNIAKMRQTSDIQAAENEEKRQERMSAAARLAAQLSNQRDLKLMDIQQQQSEANQNLAKSQANLDLAKAGLTLDQAKQRLAEEQTRLKMRNDSDVAMETGSLLREASEAKTPEERAKIAAKYARSPVADNVMLKSLSEMDAASAQAAKDKRAEELAQAKLNIQKVFDDAGGGEAGYKAAIKSPDWTKIPASEQAQWRLSQPKMSSLERMIQNAKGGQESDRVSVISPQGKRGTIPRSQLAEALKSGYWEQ